MYLPMKGANGKNACESVRQAFPKYPEVELLSTLDRAFEMLPQREQSALSTNLSLQTQNESPWTCYDIFATQKPGLLSILSLTHALPQN